MVIVNNTTAGFSQPIARKTAAITELAEDRKQLLFIESENFFVVVFKFVYGFYNQHSPYEIRRICIVSSVSQIFWCASQNISINISKLWKWRMGNAQCNKKFFFFEFYYWFWSLVLSCVKSFNSCTFLSFFL